MIKLGIRHPRKRKRNLTTRLPSCWNVRHYIKGRSLVCHPLLWDWWPSMGCTSVFCRWPYAGYTGVCELGLPHGARSFWAQRPARPLAPLLRHSLNYSTRVCQIALTIQVACLHPALCTSCWQPAVFFKKTRAVWNRASRGFNESMNSDWFVAKDSEKLFSSLVSLCQFFSIYSSSLSLSLSHWENRTKSWVVLRLRADKILGQCSIHLKKIDSYC